MDKKETCIYYSRPNGCSENGRNGRQCTLVTVKGVIWAGQPGKSDSVPDKDQLICRASNLPIKVKINLTPEHFNTLRAGR